MQAMLEKSQRLQQQAVQQQQFQQQQQQHLNQTMSHTSPIPQMDHQTPSNNVNNVRTLVDNFPRLLEMKRAGTLKPEQEKLVGTSPIIIG